MSRVTATLARPWMRDLVIVVAAASAYFISREIVEGDEADAIANAERLMTFERAVGLDIERSVQDVVLEHHVLVELGDLSYVWLHWPLLIVALAVVYRFDHGLFRRLRDAMCWSGAVGVLLFWVFPVAPPRFMSGFVGTVSDAERRHFIPFPMDWANRFAAFPSFHVGWTLIACLAVAALVGSRWAKAAILTPALLVTLSVVSTGNHYVLDALVGLVLAVAAYALLPVVHRPHPRHVVPNAWRVHHHHPTGTSYS